jgi:ElaB/YqjD/DUF883 family membrane-anchored ribosome-binding protein
MAQSNSNIDLSTFLQLQSQYTNDISQIPIDPSQTGNANAIHDLSNQLSTMYNSLSTSTASAQNTIDEQNKINSILQNEYNRLEQKKQNITAAVEGQKRVIELNNSYQKRYTAYTNIMIALVVTLIIYLIINYLDNNVPVFPKVILYVLTIILFSVAIIYISWVSIDIMRRDNINFDELALARPQTDPSGNVITTNMTNQTFNPLGYYGCIGQACCAPGTIWDSISGGCVNSTPCGVMASNLVSVTKTPTSILAPTTKQGFETMNTIAYSNEFLLGQPEGKIDKNTLISVPVSKDNYCTDGYECYALFK